MIVTFRTGRIRTLDQVRSFAQGDEAADFRITGRTSARAFVRRTPIRFEHHGPEKPAYGFSLFIRRGNGIISRTWGLPVIHATVRSTPRPKPECGNEPYLRRSRYQS